MASKKHEWTEEDLRRWQEDEARRNRMKGWKFRFSQKQQLRREWVCFSDIAGLHAERAAPSAVNDYRKRAYELLLSAFYSRRFEVAGHPRILFIHPDISLRWMETDFLQKQEGYLDPAELRSEVLDFCWMPRALFDKWAERHDLKPDFPPLAQPLSASAPAVLETSQAAQADSQPVADATPPVPEPAHSTTEKPATQKQLEALVAEYLEPWVQDKSLAPPPSVTGLAALAERELNLGIRHSQRRRGAELKKQAEDKKIALQGIGSPKQIIPQ